MINEFSFMNDQNRWLNFRSEKTFSTRQYCVYSNAFILWKLKIVVVFHWQMMIELMVDFTNTYQSLWRGDFMIVTTVNSTRTGYRTIREWVKSLSFILLHTSLMLMLIISFLILDNYTELKWKISTATQNEP